MISLCPLTVLPCSPIEQIDAAIEAGFDSIGLRLTKTLATDIDVMADKPLRDAVAKRLSETGIGVLDVEVVRISPNTDVAALLPLLQYAGDIGARSVAITGEPKADWQGAWLPEHETAMADNLARLCEAAARHGTGCALEFMIYRSIDTLASALRLQGLVDQPNLTVTIDALHFARSGATLEELAAVDPAVFSCFQICDAPREAPTDLPREARFGRRLPGQGDLPLGDILRALGEGVPVAVEVPDASLADQSVVARALGAARATRDVMASVGRAWG